MPGTLTMHDVERQSKQIKIAQLVVQLWEISNRSDIDIRGAPRWSVVLDIERSGWFIGSTSG